MRTHRPHTHTQYNTHWISIEFSTCSKLMRFLSRSSLCMCGGFVCLYIFFACSSRVHDSHILLHARLCKLLLMILHSWQDVAAGIIINFHALRAVKRFFRSFHREQLSQLDWEKALVFVPCGKWKKQRTNEIYIFHSMRINPINGMKKASPMNVTHTQKN